MKKKMIIDDSKLIKEWDYSKNKDLNPATLSTGSGKKAWWICHVCNNNWETQIYLRKKHGCPNCAHKKVGKANSKIKDDNNTLIKVFPDVIKVWDYQKNGNLKPENFSPKSNKKVWWKCSKCGKEWEASIYAKSHTTICKKCTYADNKRDYVKSGRNDLKTMYPEIAKEWNYEKNNCLTPDKIAKASKKIAWWKCSKCGYEWEQSVVSRTKNSNSVNCPACNNKKVFTGFNDLATTNPELLKEWDYKKNKIKPSLVVSGSNTKVWWICPKGHSYEASIGNRTKISGGTGCPFCAGQKILKGYNDLASQYPNLLNEWNYQKNIIKPDEISSKSGKIVWWICPKGHEWKSVVYNRTKNGNRGCPICANREIITGFNDLATTNPELLKEWDYKKNKIKPTEIISGSTEKAWWICEKGHSWPATIVSRTKNHFCPICNSSKQTSISEKSVVYYLKKSGLEVIESYKIKRKEIDIFIPKLNIGIEYDGQYYHKNIKKDIDKNKLCESMGITLIRIREPELPLLNSSSIDFVIDNLTSDHSYMNNVINKLLRYLKIKNIDVDVERDFNEIYSLYQKGEKRESIISEFPNLIEEWDYDKNKISPKQISKGTHLSVWWKCKKCNYSWEAKVYARCNGSGCPNCAGTLNRKKPSKLQVGINDFATEHKKMLHEWDYNKNKIKPSEISSGSNMKIWWICDKGHSYDSSITNRLKGTACPYCANKKVLKGYNDLKTTNPDIANEWNYEKNKGIYPDEFTIGSGKKVWWKCSKCGKEWESIIYTRKTGALCGKCKRKETK